MIKVTPGFLLVLSASVYFGSFALTMAFLLASALHELGHIIAARSFGLSVRKLILSAQGAQLTLSNAPSSFFQELAICLAGPLVNLLLVAVCCVADLHPVFLGANLLLGLFNLLPIRPLDGGNGLFALLSILTTWQFAEGATRSLSIITAILTIVLGVYLFCVEGGRPYLLLLGVWLLSYSIGK